MTGPAYVLSRSAAADLRDISRHTAEQWGEAQRQTYVQQLQDATTALAQGRGVFRPLDSLLPGLRVTTSGKHHIFCLLRENQPALILAILHERMDLMARLKGHLRT